ncbi:maleylpyruvate isomerase N-terminal domain-containing protein [Streptomyces sp. F-1]|uniref:maleylpyruvate isomerase N-terminal domain-containing protein n=1 Tax=Streptomyces sp. F-1 TaxID=463642 RepID=UPI00085C6C0E|nr:maleylpyruvate isomerase N-terminal domain-containing protein [Streptomyces sp. F-1]SFY49641.1 hypothetical protein STEPF1_02880 [Streptomyces sp. F-1]
MTTDRTDFDPAAALARIAAATGQLLGTAAKFTDADVRAPSLLPDWSRGHVLTHLARNADGGRHPLTWARTGTETPEYPSLAARAEQIESGAGRGAAELLADLRDSAAAFEAEYRRMPPEGWHRIVRWTRGHAPAVRLHATDTGTGHVIGGDPSAPVVRGSQGSLPAWLMGRSPGTDLVVDDARDLPRPPFLY